ncbi:MAG: SCO family protein [Anaerolineae bacterium]
MLTREWRRVGAAVIGAMLLLALAGCQAAAPASPSPAAPPSASDHVAPDFLLTDQNGRPFRLSDHRGKVVLLNFGYSNCPDVCPATLADLAKARQMLGADAGRVEVVFLTVDPQRDTPERLKTYLAAFDSTFIGVTGPATAMRPIWRAYTIRVDSFATPSPGAQALPSDYLLGHTSLTFIIDAKGMIQDGFPAEYGAENIANDVRKALRS